MSQFKLPLPNTDPSEIKVRSTQSSPMKSNRSKNEALEKVRANLKAQMFAGTKSFSMSPIPDDDSTPKLTLNSASSTPINTGRSNFEKMRSRVKMSLFPCAREESSFTSALSIEPTSQNLTDDENSGKKISTISTCANSKNKIDDPAAEENKPYQESGLLNVKKIASLNNSCDKIEENKSPETGKLSVEREDSHEDSEQLFDPTANNYIYKHSIFFNNVENEVEQLKKDLEVENDSDVHFIQGDFYNYYTEQDIIGEGTTGTVKRCMKNGTNDIYAVKIVHYRDDTEMLVMIVKEFKNQRKLSHKNIIKVYEIYIDYYTKKIYTIMELAECQEMFEVLRDLGHYSEAVASRIFKQILKAINYLHLNGVCHRDLKPNNILVSRDGEKLKITDFNVSKFIEKKGKKYTSLSSENYKMWTYTGTIAFTAPEVFMDQEYTESVDMWSAGVVLYTMLCGYQPFQAEYVNDLIELIKAGKYEFHPDPWDNISDMAKDLVRHLLDVNYKTRYSPSQALMHPWISNQGKVPNKKISGIQDNFRKNAKKNIANDSDLSLTKKLTHIDRDEEAETAAEVLASLSVRKRRSETLRITKREDYLAKIKEIEAFVAENCSTPKKGMLMSCAELPEVSALEEESPYISKIARGERSVSFKIDLLDLSGEKNKNSL